jgi:hypothetical protein
MRLEIYIIYVKHSMGFQYHGNFIAKAASSKNIRITFLQLYFIHVVRELICMAAPNTQRGHIEAIKWL